MERSLYVLQQLHDHINKIMTNESNEYELQRSQNMLSDSDISRFCATMNAYARVREILKWYMEKEQQYIDDSMRIEDIKMVLKEILEVLHGNK